MLLQLVYLSTATRPMPPADLEALLVATRARNAADELTGLLLYADRQFMQALEGPGPAVLATYERIRRDDRHTSLIEMLRQEVAERSFPDWSMGFHSGSHAELADLPGYSDFLARRDEALRADVAHAFLRSFRSSAQRFRL